MPKLRKENRRFRGVLHLLRERGKARREVLPVLRQAPCVTEYIRRSARTAVFICVGLTSAV